ncbi:MAG: PQQ-dependent dehydrogenase, methanol/ethanol family [Rhodocyclaceae bacterium]|nr:PQQ-dependent dehydrogenase, methanol/ethanol family [Rhodocyclaceae bacterium]
MTLHRQKLIVAGLLSVSVLASSAFAAADKMPAAVDTKRLIAADTEPGNWMSHGRTYSEQRFSPLEQINDANVSRLGLAWAHKFDDERGVETTPIVVDGVMYSSGPWSKVVALNAKTGAVLWKFDPKVEKIVAAKGCCDVANRGVAVWEGKVFVGSYDGRLIALDAKTGKQLWSTLTVDPKRSYTISGAPRVVNGLVLIGNGGAELGVRGYVSAYDGKTGKMKWRFYTVPGDPKKPYESDTMKMAAKTWDGDQYYKWGGGGTVWDSISYDPELNLIYLGVGNPSPWNPSIRSPGNGDNLFISSIVAIRPDTGKYVWHFQLSPRDAWDYPASSQVVQATLPIDGKPRKVLMQVPKHGFVYVIDRETGKLISAEKYTEVNWADGYDLKTGRPILTGKGDYSKEPKLVFPGTQGGHNWQPISFSPKSGLLYFGETRLPSLHISDPTQKFADRGRRWNIGEKIVMPETPAEMAELEALVGGSLIAWDPVTQKKVWQIPHAIPVSGGTLSTAGNLVFQGTYDGRFVAYADKTGKVLWESKAQTGVMAGPISYSVDGEQYIAVGAGLGGSFGVTFGDMAKATKMPTISRMLVYKLEGKATLPPPPPAVERKLDLPPMPSTANVDKGRELFNTQCVFCHGVAAVSGVSFTPDLRYISKETREQFAGIVMGGLRADKGMPHFHVQLTMEELNLVHDYLIKRSYDAKEGK